MIRCFQNAMRSILWLALLLFVIAQGAMGQSTNTRSIPLGGGTLTYTVATKGRQPCNPNQRTLIPEFEEWTFDQFVYKDATGAIFSFSGGVFFIEDLGGNAGCPGTSGTSTVFNGSAFTITVQAGPGTLTATFNKLIRTHNDHHLHDYEAGVHKAGIVSAAR